MFSRRSRIGLLVAAVGALVAASAGAATADNIGVAATVKNDVLSILGSDRRSLNVGSQVFALEVIQTGDDAQAQLIFLDETTLAIGPSSEITLDRFVFDPSGGAGDVVMSAARGAFRFITGSQQPQSYTLNTPVATIGVRGTIFDVISTIIGWYIFNVQGIVVSTVAGVERELQPGEGLFIDMDGNVSVVGPDNEIRQVIGAIPFFTGFVPDQLDLPEDQQIIIEDLLEHEPEENECPYNECCIEC